MVQFTHLHNQVVSCPPSGISCFSTTTSHYRCFQFSILSSHVTTLVSGIYLDIALTDNIIIYSACAIFNHLICATVSVVHIVICLQEVGNLTAFRSPYHAVAKTLLQLAGEFDFEATFNEGTLLYTQTTYILFIIFLITMPILFTNLLVSTSV